MDHAVFLSLALACAPQVHAGTANALVAVESGHNPHAIGVVGGALLRQPRNAAEALATARALQAQGWNFSVGLAQINVHNLPRLGLTLDQAFEPCSNLGAMQTILGECNDRALQREPKDTASAQRGLRRALSCYYSGNFVTGFEHGYVRRVALAAALTATATASPLPVPTTKEAS
jgi:type IV secretion system protein VirB1